ncbi:hypothetical protein ECSTEC7V_2845 [Escherichia coli STEC_7v]|nr:hypothetical protein ECSTEC7V_2845 [Escherichia coli STEC_7v]
MDRSSTRLEARGENGDKKYSPGAREVLLVRFAPHAIEIASF